MVAAAVVFAVTFELVPDRLDLGSTVLQFAGLGAIVGTAVSLIAERRDPDRRRARLVEYFTVAGAAIGLGIFLAGALEQAVG